MDQASRELTRLVDQDPDNAMARTNLGVVLIQQGKVEQAGFSSRPLCAATPVWNLLVRRYSRSEGRGEARVVPTERS